MRKILLVEDEPLLRETYEIILATQPYKSDVAENGEQALQMFNSQTYDLVLLDIMMPVMNGVQFLEELNKTNAAEKSKIVIMSNLSSGREFERARELGVDDFILKSDLSPKQLIARIRSYLKA